MKKMNQIDSNALLGDIRQMIEKSRLAVAATVNSTLTMLYWQIGKRISSEILQGVRAKYGEEIVSTLSRQLTQEYGNGYSVKNLRHMIRFYESFPDKTIVSTLWRLFSWSHFKEIGLLKNKRKYIASKSVD